MISFAVARSDESTSSNGCLHEFVQDDPATEGLLVDSISHYLNERGSVPGFQTWNASDVAAMAGFKFN